MHKSLFITTPIFYPNDRLHLGNAYPTVVADIIARYKKSQGYQVYFQTGSDEHGEKIEKKAFSLGLTPQQLVDKNVSLFQQLWKELNISDHVFYRTSSSPQHKEKVQKIFTKFLEKGDIYLGKYKGSYCVTCEDYVSEGKITKKKTCPLFHSELQEIEEPAYFLCVSKYRSWLVEYYSQNPNFLLPANVRKELFENFLKNDLPDLCVTRQNVKWGISVPSDPKLVIYVWIDALSNYLNSEAGERFFFSKEINNEIIQVIGKEITRFHAIYWPIILKLLGARLPNKILVHGWLVDPAGEKASKSKGNVIDPLKLVKKYPSDLVRTYMVAKINFLQDGVCTEELLRSFYQDFFVNNLSNLVSRVNKMLHLYNNGIIPKFEKNEKLINYYQQCKLSVEEFQKKMDQYELTSAFSHIQNLLDSSNKLITDLAPWKLARKGEKILLHSTLNYLSNGIKILTFLLSCVIPETSKKIFKVFNINQEKIDWKNCLEFDFLNGIQTKLLEKHLYELIIS